MNSSSTQQDKSIVRIKKLCRQFGEQTALDDISIDVSAGQVFGIVGENGAGKTTLIKHMLGQYVAHQGSVEMFGEDPVAEPKHVLSKIGYLSEEPDMPSWMTVKELLAYTSAFYPAWSDDYALELVERFALDLGKRVRDLSKGQKARVGLVLAQAYKPELLLLDEPSSGLDPNVRRDILSAVIKTVSDEGRTVIFSSHLLDEVERVCDHLVMIDKGRVLLLDSMEHILGNHHRMIVKLETTDSHRQLLALDSVLNMLQIGDEWQVDFYGEIEQFKSQIQSNNVSIISSRTMSLNDIFIARTRRSEGGLSDD
jgi:ABC-2 type transport system ATP-binding protein